MARNRSQRNSRSGRRGRNNILGTANVNPQPMLSLTPSEAFERMLGRTNDSCVLRGKVIINVTTLGSSPFQVGFLVPNFFGARATAFGSVFSRFRIKAMNIRFMQAVTGGTQVPTVVGVLDDTNSSSTLPTTGSDVLELRSSAFAQPGQTIPCNVLYTPVDKTKWYYIGAPTGTDNRLAVPGFLYAYTSAAATFPLEVDFSLVFAGAADNGVS
jgi:hypothetical protein